MKELSQKIEADPEKRRCYNATMCFELVKNGPNVYIDVNFCFNNTTTIPALFVY